MLYGITHIFKHYGWKKQSMQYCEEMGELIVALSKLSRKPKDEKAKENVKEELVDNYVMFKQFQRWLRIDQKELNRLAQEKIDRQLERIKGEKKNEL